MIKTDRNQYVASHVTDAVKKALVERAKERGVSVSRYVYECLRDKLGLKR